MQEEGSPKFTARSTFPFQDHKALYAALRKKNRQGRWTMHLLLIEFVLLCFLVTSFSRGFLFDEGPHWMGLWAEFKPYSVFMALVLLLWELALQFSYFERAAFKKCSSAGKAIIYRLDERAASWETAGMRCEYEWRVIDWAVLTPDAIVLVVNGVQGLVLPVRGFALREEFEAAAEFVRGKIPASMRAAGS